MRLKMTKLDVWMAEIDDQPGALARTLRAVADFGVDLEAVVARRHREKHGKGILYLTSATDHVRLEEAGLRPAPGVVTLKIEGVNAPGMGAKLTRSIGDAGISLRGLTATAIGRKFVCYAGFDSIADLEKAKQALEPMTQHHWPRWHHKSEEKVKVPA